MQQLFFDEGLKGLKGKDMADSMETICNPLENNYVKITPTGKEGSECVTRVIQTNASNKERNVTMAMQNDKMNKKEMDDASSGEYTISNHEEAGSVDESTTHISNKTSLITAESTDTSCQSYYDNDTGDYKSNGYIVSNGQVESNGYIQSSHGHALPVNGSYHHAHSVSNGYIKSPTLMRKNGCEKDNYTKESQI